MTRAVYSENRVKNEWFDDAAVYLTAHPWPQVLSAFVLGLLLGAILF